MMMMMMLDAPSQTPAVKRHRRLADSAYFDDSDSNERNALLDVLNACDRTLLFPTQVGTVTVKEVSQ